MNLLMVDDEPAVIRFLTIVAEASPGIQIDSAPSGEEALGMVVKKNYDMITLDIHMPGASGFEVLALIRHMCPHAVIVILSGNVRENELPEIAGCADLIMEKPMDTDVFTELLEGAQKIRDHLNQLKDKSDISVPLYRAGTLSSI